MGDLFADAALGSAPDDFAPGNPWPYQEWARSPFDMYRAISAVHELGIGFTGEQWALAQLAALSFTQRLDLPAAMRWRPPAPAGPGPAIVRPGIVPDDLLRLKGAALTWPPCTCPPGGLSADQPCTIPDIVDCEVPADSADHYYSISRAGPSTRWDSKWPPIPEEIPLRRWAAGEAEPDPVRPETVQSASALWALVRVGATSGFGPGPMIMEPVGGTTGAVLARHYLKGLAYLLVDDGSEAFWPNEIPSPSSFEALPEKQRGNAVVASYAALLSLFEGQRALLGLFGRPGARGIPLFAHSSDGSQMRPLLSYAQGVGGLFHLLASAWGDVEDWPPIPAQTPLV